MKENGGSGIPIPHDDKSLEELAAKYHPEEEAEVEGEGVDAESSTDKEEAEDGDVPAEEDPMEAYYAIEDEYLEEEAAKRPKESGGSGKRTGGAGVKTIRAIKTEQTEKARRNRFEKSLRVLGAVLKKTPLTKSDNEKLTQKYVSWVQACIDAVGERPEDRVFLECAVDDIATAATEEKKQLKKKIDMTDNNLSKDFKIAAISGPSGGQHRDRHANGVELTHKLSGVSGSGVDRDREVSKKLALKAVKKNLAEHIDEWGSVLSSLSPKKRIGGAGATKIRETLERIKNPSSKTKEG